MNAALRYPLEVGGLTDYVMFTPTRYRTNASTSGSSAAPFSPRPDGTGGASPPADLRNQPSIVMYMPNSTPTISNGQGWAGFTFLGPLGEAQRDGARALGDLADNLTDARTFDQGLAGIDQTAAGIINDITTKIETGKAKDALLQIGQNAAAGFLGVSANQQLALARGKVYNPNVELFYSSPAIRSFTMSFSMIPKSQEEANIVNAIIRQFKRWSSPAKRGTSMFEVPYVWRVQYMSGSSVNRNMNEFKLAACTNVAVQANPQTPMHVAHFDGMPVVTGLQLSFMEVDIITREDHTGSKTYQGF